MSFPAELHPLNQEPVRDCLNLAGARNTKLYLVGGYVRDSLMGRSRHPRANKDFDFAVEGAKAVEFAEAFAAESDGHLVPLDNKNDTARVVLKDGTYFDFAGCLGNSMEADIRRRDFTINAIYWDPQTPDRIYDPLNGQADLEAKLIRCPGESVLDDDPLRLLRAFRFAASLDFQIEEKTMEWIRAKAGKLANVAAERVSYEFFIMADSPKSAPHVVQMGKLGILEAIFPELVAQREVSSNSYHHLGLFDHSVEAYCQSEYSLKDMPDWLIVRLEESLSQQASRLAATKVASLLHDIGKPQTWVITAEGKHTFIGHDKLGAQMCAPLAKRLRWAKPLERFVSKLVRWHLRPGALFHQGPPTDKAIYRFFRTVDEDLPELILLAISDFRATCGPGLQAGRQEAERKVLELLEKFVVFREGQKKAPQLIDGEELMKLLGITPGPLVGEILDELKEAQALGEVQDRDQALIYVRKIYAKENSNS